MSHNFITVGYSDSTGSVPTKFDLYDTLNKTACFGKSGTILLDSAAEGNYYVSGNSCSGYFVVNKTVKIAYGITDSISWSATVPFPCLFSNFPVIVAQMYTASSDVSSQLNNQLVNYGTHEPLSGTGVYYWSSFELVVSSVPHRYFWVAIGS